MSLEQLASTPYMERLLEDPLLFGQFLATVLAVALLVCAMIFCIFALRAAGAARRARSEAVDALTSIEAARLEVRDLTAQAERASLRVQEYTQKAENDSLEGDNDSPELGAKEEAPEQPKKGRKKASAILSGIVRRR